MEYLDLSGIDGTKIRASAGRRNTYSKEELDNMIEGVEAAIARLLEDGKAIDQEEDNVFGSNKTGDEVPDELKKKKGIKEDLKQVKEILEQRRLKQVNLKDPDKGG